MAGNRNDRVIEELTSTGEGSGLERLRPGAPASSASLDPERIDLQTRTMTVDQLLARLRDGTAATIDGFRPRAGLWDAVRQSRLIESLFLKIPLPPFYAAEDAGENWTIVDGVQRLGAILRFVDPALAGAEPLVLEGLEYLDADFGGKAFSAVSPRLQRRLKETELVIHVVRHGTPLREKFNILARVNTAAEPLSGQEIRQALIAGAARDILAEMTGSKEFRGATGDSVRDERMGAADLALRFAAFRLFPPAEYEAADFELFLGDAMEALSRLAEEAGSEAAAPPPEPVPEPEPEPADDAPADLGDPAEAEEEAAPAEPAEQEAPAETEPTATERLAALSADFRAAMTAARAIFGEDAFRKPATGEGERNPINRALFETLSVCLAELAAEDRDRLCGDGAALRLSLNELLQNRAFDAAISQPAGDPAAVRKRFAEMGKLLKKAL